MTAPHPTPVIALDGHAGAGKSTVAKAIAAQLQFWHVNTGLYYRGVTWLALQQGLSLQHQAALEALAQTADIDVREVQGQEQLFVNGQQLNAEVRTPEINQAISTVSAYPGVREAITSRLQQLSHPRGIIMDGRDIGTVVFPQAQLKIFLTASVAERARRQHEEAQAQGIEISLADFQALVAARDRQDSEREVAPLRQAPDAVLVDSTAQSPAEIVASVLQLWAQKQSASKA